MPKKPTLEISFDNIIRLTTALALLVAGALVFLTVTFVAGTISKLSAVGTTAGVSAKKNDGVDSATLEKLMARQAERTSPPKADSKNVANPFVSMPAPPPAPPASATPTTAN